MKRVSMSLSVILGLGLAGCASTESQFVEPTKLMADMIQERIRQIPYQHKSELLTNLLWLTQAGEQAIPNLASALADPNPKVRSSAAWVFGRMGDRRVIPYLQQRKNEPNEIARLEIARSLLLLGDYSMVPELIAGLDSQKQHVRYLCYDALHTTTGRSFEYDHRAVDPADRSVSVSRWQDWWQKQRSEWKGTSGRLGQPAAPQNR